MGMPTRERGNILASAALKIAPSHTLKLDAYFSMTETEAKIAAVPGELSIDPAGPLGRYLDLIGYTGTEPATVYYAAPTSQTAPPFINGTAAAA